MCQHGTRALPKRSNGDNAHGVGIFLVERTRDAPEWSRVDAQTIHIVGSYVS